MSVEIVEGVHFIVASSSYQTMMHVVMQMSSSPTRTEIHNLQEQLQEDKKISAELRGN